MSWKLATPYSRSNFGTLQPTCTRCQSNFISNGSHAVDTLCPKCKWQNTTGLVGVNITHTPLGGKTVPLSSESLASKTGSLSNEERTKWQKTIKTELSKPRFKIGDPIVQADHVGWGRLLKKQDDETPLTSSPRHGKELSEQMFWRYLGKLPENEEEDSVPVADYLHINGDDDFGSEDFIHVTAEEIGDSS